MPDDLYGIRQAIKAGFDKELVGITPTDKRFDGFNGVNYGRYSYVNLNANRGFVNVAGHELYHSLEKERPDILRANQLKISLDDDPGGGMFARL